MNKALLFNFEVIRESNQIKVERSFQAPIDLVWAAWTEADILDQWWAPKPYTCNTVSMDFREGGRWHYFMLGPTGDKHNCLFDYEKIIPQQFYSGIDAFCDDNQVISDTKPRVKWENQFLDQEEEVVVSMLLSFESFEDLEQLIQMGFKEGFTMGMENLDQYIASQFYLRKSKKPDNAPRVSSYVNFPGNTEEALNFYKSVFKTEFVQGIQKFGDIPPQEGQPPMPESMKKLVLHAELPLLGGHILMATDAPKEMGFNLTSGNNMHICLEPDSREEAQRLFNELSVGGKVEMPLQDMFWGSYYGNFQDRYGINWMVNYQPK